MPSDEYLAGFLDGEACILIARTGNNFYLQVKISQVAVKRAVLDRLQERFGGTINEKTFTARGMKRAAVEWRVCSQQAAAVLEAAIPYLIVKADEARVALEFQNSKRTLRRGPKFPLTDEEIDKYERFKNELSRMKHVEE